MNMDKTFKGRLANWNFMPCLFGKGFYVTGIFLDHEVFTGQYGHTSYVVNYLENTGEIETLNSRYQLSGKRAPLTNPEFDNMSLSNISLHGFNEEYPD